MRILAVVARRSDLLAAAPLVAALRGRSGFRAALLHLLQQGPAERNLACATDFGAHGLAGCDLHLGVNAGGRGLADAMDQELEPLLRRERPELLLVAGDDDADLSAARIAVRLGLAVAHLEAGLRFPHVDVPGHERRARLDHLSAWCFTADAEADRNLRQEGVPESRIVRVGSPRADAVLRLRAAARAAAVPARLGLAGAPYAALLLEETGRLGTEGFLRLAAALREAAAAAPLPILAPSQPGTAVGPVFRVWSPGRTPAPGHLWLLPPLSVVELLGLAEGAAAVVTDSTAVADEAAVLGVPCLLLRDASDRPWLLREREGTTLALGWDAAALAAGLADAAGGTFPTAGPPALSDGRAALRVVQHLAFLSGEEAAVKPAALAADAGDEEAD